jgi:hypothetical protein
MDRFPIAVRLSYVQIPSTNGAQDCMVKEGVPPEVPPEPPASVPEYERAIPQPRQNIFKALPSRVRDLQHFVEVLQVDEYLLCPPRVLSVSLHEALPAVKLEDDEQGERNERKVSMCAGHVGELSRGYVG